MKKRIETQMHTTPLGMWAWRVEISRDAEDTDLREVVQRSGVAKTLMEASAEALAAVARHA